MAFPNLFRLQDQRSFSLPQDLTFPPNLSSKICTDKLSLSSVSTDFGNLTEPKLPIATLNPKSPHDISTLITLSHSSPNPFVISPRGNGHSINGQASALDGVVINMLSLSEGHKSNDGIKVSVLDRFVDVRGEKLWIDVLHETLKYGLSPRSWTDYLYLTVGGTLSVGGISGQTSRYGPQISNVIELDVITGKGETITCSKDENSDLFHAVLGGMGQFGVITRAKIPLFDAPDRVKWVRLVYADIETFTKDQEHLISLNNNNDNHNHNNDDGKSVLRSFDYLEGSLWMYGGLTESWRASDFFTGQDVEDMSRLAHQHELNGLYYIEGAVYYKEDKATTMDHKLKQLLKGLNYSPGFVFTQDVSYMEFLNRVHDGELKLREAGQWDVPHPWLNLFMPKSRILDFDYGVFKGILEKNNFKCNILIYPMNRNKWDDKMSTMIPDEEIFYTIALLHSATSDNLDILKDQNDKILQFCKKADIKFKQYLPHHNTKEEWMEHFGAKWDKFGEMKLKYDPKLILGSGSKIFISRGEFAI